MYKFQLHQKQSKENSTFTSLQIVQRKGIYIHTLNVNIQASAAKKCFTDAEIVSMGDSIKNFQESIHILTPFRILNIENKIRSQQAQGTVLHVKFHNYFTISDHAGAIVCNPPAPQLPECMAPAAVSQI